MRAGTAACAALVALSWITSCGAPAGAPSGSDVAREVAADPAPAKKVAAAPEVVPAPAGAQVVGKLYTQTCTDPVCPKLLQPEGDAHCKAMKLGAVGPWRLPTTEEAKAFSGVQGLGSIEGFHWTASVFAEDDKQMWIVDPAGGQSTTVPGDRKPFTIRCVADIS